MAFVVLAGGWYVANLLALAASLRNQREANAKIVALGHPAVFVNIPSAWQLQPFLRPPLYGIIGAALIAVLLRRASTRPWFVLAGALPIVVGHTYHLPGWWAPGPGIENWTSGAGVGVPGLDLSTFGAGPSWAIKAATVLVAAAVVIPAALSRPPVQPLQSARRVARALPYIALLAMGTALATGELNIDDTGAGSGHNMVIAGLSAALIALLVSWAATSDRWWRDVVASAVAVGLVTVSGLNPSAMATTKWAAFGAAAGIAVIAAAIARRPTSSGGEDGVLGRLQRNRHEIGDVAHQSNL